MGLRIYMSRINYPKLWVVFRVYAFLGRIVTGFLRACEVEGDRGCTSLDLEVPSTSVAWSVFEFGACGGPSSTAAKGGVHKHGLRAPCESMNLP